VSGDADSGSPIWRMTGDGQRQLGPKICWSCQCYINQSKRCAYFCHHGRPAGSCWVIAPGQFFCVVFWAFCNRFKIELHPSIRIWSYRIINVQPCHDGHAIEIKGSASGWHAFLKVEGVLGFAGSWERGFAVVGKRDRSWFR
jgi:hypothetical protein